MSDKPDSLASLRRRAALPAQPPGAPAPRPRTLGAVRQHVQRRRGIRKWTGDGRAGSGYGGASTADRASESAVEPLFRGLPTHALPIRELELDNRGERWARKPAGESPREGRFRRWRRIWPATTEAVWTQTRQYASRVLGLRMVTAKKSTNLQAVRSSAALMGGSRSANAARGAAG